MQSNQRCRVCGSDRLEAVICLERLPVFCNVLYPNKEEARQTSRGTIDLGFCQRCGHVGNLAFEPKLLTYSPTYENSLHFSPRFQEYAEALAAELVARYDLHGKQIVEIGSGQGDFLRLLCQLGDNRGVGYDPSFQPTQATNDLNGAITYVSEYYSEQSAARRADRAADFICCRHTLEHIAEPAEFLHMVRRSIDDRLETVVFFEVPNVMYTLRDLGIWDLIYEHCSYFSTTSLTYLFATCGFKVLRVYTTYGNQFLGIEAVPKALTVAEVAEPTAEVHAMLPYVDGFTAAYHQTVTAAQRHLIELHEKGARAVLWGAGSKGVTFLNVVQDSAQIDYVVDINPRKHGMYVAGAGQRIVAPESLATAHSTNGHALSVIVMNPIYQHEICRMLDDLGIHAEIKVV